MKYRNDSGIKNSTIKSVIYINSAPAPAWCLITENPCYELTFALDLSSLIQKIKMVIHCNVHEPFTKKT